MESKISEANTYIIIFGWCEYLLMGISIGMLSTVCNYFDINRPNVDKNPKVVDSVFKGSEPGVNLLQIESS
jgi:hypothetical protein